MLFLEPPNSSPQSLKTVPEKASLTRARLQVCAGGCSGHGECTAGACRCSGDWIGHDCRHHVLSMTHFAPEVHPSERASRCHQTAAIGRGVDAFAYRLDDLQFPSSCTSLFQRRFNKTQGLGATLRWTALSLSVSLSRGETLVVGGRWGAFNYEGCADRGVWCLLQRITNCTVSSWAWDDIAEADFFMPDQLSIPYGGVEQGQLWWTSLLTHAALRPSVLLEVLHAPPKLEEYRGSQRDARCPPPCFRLPCLIPSLLAQCPCVLLVLILQ